MRQESVVTVLPQQLPPKTLVPAETLTVRPKRAVFGHQDRAKHHRRSSAAGEH
jgi:hypothetical protein